MTSDRRELRSAVSHPAAVNACSITVRDPTSATFSQSASRLPAFVLAGQLDTWLRQHGYNLVSAPLPPDAINTLIDCFVIEDEGCARKVVEKRAKSKSVVFARVEVQQTAQSERTVTLTYLRGDRPGVYSFTDGRLRSMELAAVPEPVKTAKKQGKPAKPARPAQRAAQPNQVSVQ